MAGGDPAIVSPFARIVNEVKAETRVEVPREMGLLESLVAEMMCNCVGYSQCTFVGTTMNIS